MQTTKAPVAENKMGTMSVGRLLLSMSIPMMFSMLIQALYNIIDSIYIARLSEKALTAVSLAFPLQSLMISFAVGTSVGVNSLIARRLGEQKRCEAEKAAGNGIVLMLFTWAVFGVLGLLLPARFIGLFTSDALLVDLGSTYLGICMVFSFGVFLSVVFEKIIQATGETTIAMLMQLIGAVINIILDPILIFGIKGLVPSMGIAGAAIATVTGQIGSMVFGLVMVRKNRFITVRILKSRFDRKITGETYKVGLPSIIMQAMGTVMTSGMNAILIQFHEIATTVFGAYFKLQSFVFLPVFGLNSGLTPIVGYNFGARRPRRIRRAVRYAIMLALGMMLTGLAVFHLIPGLLLDLFNASDLMKSVGLHALRRISLAFPLAGICIVFNGVFQGVGDGIYSMLVSIVRQLGILIPTAWILGRLFGLEAVWFAFVIAETVALAISTVFYLKERRRFHNLESL
ncbi:MAG: MATE family efflux transporter [Spirochaetales bacterium]|nr:MATE family efflux transporter [Spirochaetales bacterium]